MIKFYLACLRDNVGSSTAFHAVDGRGYTTNLDKAHIYSKQEAQRAWDNGREFDLPLSASMVRALSVRKADCQYVPTETLIERDCDDYLAYKKGKWDGNDLYWLSDYGQFCTDIEKAETLSIEQAIGGPDHLVFIPKDHILKVSRLTFASSLINKRKMTQGQGLITPAHIKRQNRRVNNGKTRLNCPSCGRIVWQFNPYDFHSCKNLSCDKYSFESEVLYQ